MIKLLQKRSEVLELNFQQLNYSNQHHSYNPERLKALTYYHTHGT
jgi:hypothetical protein